MKTQSTHLMKRQQQRFAFHPVQLALLLLLWAFLGMIDGAITTASVQTKPISQDSVDTTTTLYLPLIANDTASIPTPEPTPTPIPEAMKQWSGIHLGNKSGNFAAGWSEAEMVRIDPTVGGTWPKVLVVLSNQIYNVVRYDATHPETPCQIERVEVSAARTTIFDYLKRASAVGTKLVIRIEPSPGNFYNEVVSEQVWRRLSIGGPVNDAGEEDLQTGYCDENRITKNRRSADDIAKEIALIHLYNLAQGFVDLAGEATFAFEPANEPNLEWYATPRQNFFFLPEEFKTEVWKQVEEYPGMDEYFAEVYDLAHMIVPSNYPSVNVLTPPMAQHLNAETTKSQKIRDENGNLQYLCAPMWLIGTGAPAPAWWLDDDNNAQFVAVDDSTGTVYFIDDYTGYAFMPQVVRGAPGVSPKNDGFSWHNYWDYGPTNSEVYVSCRTGGNGQHVSTYFPEWLTTQIRIEQRPTFITEADIHSTLQNPTTPLFDKDEGTSGVYALAAAESLQNFFEQEVEEGGSPEHYGVSPYIAAWLLNDDTSNESDSPPDESCVRDHCDLDHNWHEAYRDYVDENGTWHHVERDWFRIWWVELAEDQ